MKKHLAERTSPRSPERWQRAVMIPGVKGLTMPEFSEFDCVVRPYEKYLGYVHAPG